MRTCLLCWALLVATGCGGTIAENPGVSETGADSGAVLDTSTPSDAVVADTLVTPDTVTPPPDMLVGACMPGYLVEPFKACKVKSDCIARTSTRDCCGSQLWVGVSKPPESFDFCEKQANAGALCDCIGRSPTAESGRGVDDPALVTVDCVAGRCLADVLPPDPATCIDDKTGTVPRGLRACKTDKDCTSELHQTDCCGTKQLIGISVITSSAYGACEKAYADRLPRCRCVAKPTTTEDGIEVGKGGATFVSCSFEGICRTAASLPK